MIALANGATAKLGRDPRQSREALESISELGRQALADTQRLLSILRTEEGATARAPQPGIAEIADLVGRAAATGLAVTLTVRGDSVPVAASLGLSAYRIVQEAITNAMKHAEGATTLAVELTWTSCRLEIAVTDDAHGHGGSAGPTFDLDEYAFGALRLGASGFILKDVLPPEFVRAIRSRTATPSSPRA